MSKKAKNNLEKFSSFGIALLSQLGEIEGPWRWLGRLDGLLKKILYQGCLA